MSSHATATMTREARSAHTREIVLDAAIELFSVKGCDGTALRDIAELSGVKQPLILYHFESKELLWRSAVDEVWGRMESRLFDWATQHGLTTQDDGQLAGLGEPESLRIVMRAFLQAVSDHPEYLRILLREGCHRGPRFDWLEEHHTRRNFELGTAFFESPQARGFFPRIPAAQLIYILAGALTFAFAVEADVERQTGLDPHSDAFLDAHVEALVQIFSPPS